MILYQDGRQTEDVVYFCEGESFDLKVIANASATGNYNLTPNNAMSFTNATTPVPFENIVGNNLFSKVVNIGFDFDYGSRSTFLNSLNLYSNKSDIWEV